MPPGFQNLISPIIGNWVKLLKGSHNRSDRELGEKKCEQ